MRKIKFIFTSIFISALLIVSSLLSSFAATYFSDGNFTFLKNGDGAVNVNDATQIQRIIAGLVYLV